LQSLKSRGYVKEQYAWRHYYWYLTNKGIQLRDELHLPPEIVPATLKRQTRTETARPPRAKGADSGLRAPMGEDRASYRREGGPGGADKRGEAGAGATQSFQFVRRRLCYCFCFTLFERTIMMYCGSGTVHR